MFGLTEKAISDLMKCPLDNFHIATTEIHSCNQLIKDAMNEIDEVLKSEDAETDEIIETGNDDDDEIWDLDCVALTASQKKVIPPCITLIKSSGGVLVQISKALKKLAPSKEDGLRLIHENGEKSHQHGEVLDKIIDISRQIQFKIDDLVCSIYPPQESNNIWNIIQELLNNLNAVISICSSEDLFNDSATFTKLSVIVQGVTSKAKGQIKEILNIE